MHLNKIDFRKLVWMTLVDGMLFEINIIMNIILVIAIEWEI
jgi:hypothetical protein